MTLPADQAPDGTRLLDYLDARVRRDRTVPGFSGRLCVGVKSSSGVRWWIADFAVGTRGRGDNAATTTVTTSFSSVKPKTYSVAVGLDEDGARSMLGLSALPSAQAGLTSKSKGMQLVAGDRKLLKRFVARYLRDSSAVQTRIGLMTSKAGGAA